MQTETLYSLFFSACYKYYDRFLLKSFFVDKFFRERFEICFPDFITKKVIKLITVSIKRKKNSIRKKSYPIEKKKEEKIIEKIKSLKKRKNKKQHKDNINKITITLIKKKRKSRKNIDTTDIR